MKDISYDTQKLKSTNCLVEQLIIFLVSLQPSDLLHELLIWIEESILHWNCPYYITYHNYLFIFIFSLHHSIPLTHPHQPFSIFLIQSSLNITANNILPNHLKRKSKTTDWPHRPGHRHEKKRIIVPTHHTKYHDPIPGVSLLIWFQFD